MCLSYIGGKSRIGSWIRNYIPKDTVTYVEPFSGAFWVFFKLELPAYPVLKNVVYNDVNPLNVNLFLSHYHFPHILRLGPVSKLFFTPTYCPI